MGTGEFVYTEFVRTQISSFMGSVFEEICRQYLYRPESIRHCRFSSGNWVDGGGRIRRRNGKKRLILWRPGKGRCFLESASGGMNWWMQVFCRPLWNGEKYSRVRKNITLFSPNRDLMRVRQGWQNNSGLRGLLLRKCYKLRISENKRDCQKMRFSDSPGTEEMYLLD